MLLIDCPWCGKRDETEFSYGGEAHMARPLKTEDMPDETWADYVFLRTNTKGIHREQWFHAHGCRRWFNVARHTVTNEIVAVYKSGERPTLPGEAKKKKTPARRKPTPSKASKS